MAAAISFVHMVSVSRQKRVSRNTLDLFNTTTTMDIGLWTAMHNRKRINLWTTVSGRALTGMEDPPPVIITNWPNCAASFNLQFHGYWGLVELV
jgi:hypothetical protein